ncbi:MAG: energy-coupling factor transporter ATPase [Clostridiales bacterium]|nr:energy-coupling factor transporter ATPase [Clostridiales bacterium]
MLNVIEVKNLTQIYSADTPFEQVAIFNVSFQISKGEFVGIMGHTGSGKSTLVQHLNGLIKPTSGSVLINGEDIWAEPKEIKKFRFKVGMVFQYPEHQLFEETVFADIAFGPKNMRLSDEEVEERVHEAIQFVGLSPDILDKSPFDLSGGQKRRVAIAGVIAMRPDILILDEPTAGLDPKGREEILSHISEYHKKQGATVLFVTHSMEDIARIVDRIIVIRRGEILLDGTPKEVFSEAYTLKKAGLTVPQITSVFIRLKEMGIPVDTSVYTVEQALDQLVSLKGRRSSY